MSTTWIPVTLGNTAAEVRRSADGSAYAKSARGERALAELRAERDRTAWLAGTGVRAPRVLDWEEYDDRATLVTSTVPGIPVCDVSPAQAPEALRSAGALLATLHAVPVDSCPFDRRLPVTLAAAREAVAGGHVDAEAFDAERAGRSAESLLADLEAAAPRALGAEVDDLVVCHGDPCLPNVLVDPDTLRPTGFVDLGRLGLADRHLDLALVTRSVRHPDLNHQFGTGDLPALWSAYGRTADEVERLAFYRLLDEFF